ncbi:MAG: hypothetical protein RBU21_25125 [FCB group bacterium]|jgi:hypothetical protein|nr:hypothetical protein [FCB group bacterium]
MKHIQSIGKSRPMPAGIDSSIYCQLAVILGSLGFPVSKDLIEKCIGI